MLTAEQQRFLADHYDGTASILNTAETEKRQRDSVSGHFSSTLAYETCTEGIGWAWPGEQRGGYYKLASWPHRVTWAQVRAHREAQPARLRQQLADAINARTAERYRNHKALDAIHPHRYASTRPGDKEKLDAENAHHRAADIPLRAAVRAAILAMLPLAADEPADLIEWAEALA